MPVIYIDNLPYSASEYHILQFLEIQNTDIKQIKQIKNKKGQSNGDCYINFHDQSTGVPSFFA